MGYIAHTPSSPPASASSSTRTPDATTCPTNGVTAVEDFRRGLPAEFQPLLVGPVAAITNGDASFAFLPDGSKEGWDTSDEGDAHRAAFIALCRKYLVDFVCVRFGGDEPDMAHIVDHDGIDPEEGEI
jgi:hypothetical protein